MSDSARKSLEGEKYLEIELFSPFQLAFWHSSLFIPGNTVATKSSHWCLPVESGIESHPETLPILCSVSVLQDSLCMPGMMTVRVPHCTHFVPRYVNTFTVVTAHTRHICELTVLGELLIFLEAQVGSWSLVVTGQVFVGDHSVN